ncbi:MAG TPA: pyridoxamine 5'-phosphate oxidase family protein [Chitinolyticbacter sp.]|nr:pyridoxamine 5'-phosphate oxidase family protein [Chitinolyticbacter sp.]
MALPGWSHQASPFHQGEQAVQRRVGVRDKVEAIGRQVVRDYMPEQHRSFFAQLPMLLLGALDADGQPWATLLMGEPGFAHSPDPRTLRIAAETVSGDPLQGCLGAGAAVGLLGIELQTRRRNRMNGRITAHDESGLAITVQHSFGNCPQYIQQRDVERVDLPAILPAAEHSATLDPAAIAQISLADTFFIATSGQPMDDDARGLHGADVSHRGGKPGFVRIDDAQTLTWPDFLGNFHFNTLGNLQINPRAGLLFPDFARGDLLYVAGRAEVIWDGAELAAFAGAERLVRLCIERVIRLRERMPLRWALQQYSPVLDHTGDWQVVADAVALAANANAYRPLRLVRREAESATITSFYLQATDGKPLASYRAGQFLPIRIDHPKLGRLHRTYTLSQAPDGHHYRISIKRDGQVSQYLHDALLPGELIDAQAPHGDFVLDAASNRPVLLLSGGVGITPMLAMLDELAPSTGPRHRPRPVWFIHAARNGVEHAFGSDLRERATQHAQLKLHVRYSQPAQDDTLGISHDSVGRIDADLLRSLLPLDDYDVYLCGPDAFMRQVYWVLRGLGIQRQRIHYERFAQGEPLEADQDGPIATPAPTTPQPVTLVKSGRTIAWQPGSTLLELVELHGLNPPYSCRAGLCGSCSTTIREGSVCYPQTPAHAIPPGQALICCAMPAGALALEL